jgi:hypothetical protein
MLFERRILGFVIARSTPGNEQEKVATSEKSYGQRAKELCSSRSVALHPEKCDTDWRQ